MSNYEWTTDISVGNMVLDQHHQNLLLLFNDAYDILTQIKPSTETMKIIKELVTYSIFHFNEEEKMMRAVNFEGLDEHIMEHQFFISKIHDFKEDLPNKPENINEEIFLFLYEWVITHIQKTDMKYAKALQSK